MLMSVCMLFVNVRRGYRGGALRKRPTPSQRPGSPHPNVKFQLSFLVKPILGGAPEFGECVFVCLCIWCACVICLLINNCILCYLSFLLIISLSINLHICLSFHLSQIFSQSYLNMQQVDVGLWFSEDGFGMDQLESLQLVSSRLLKLDFLSSRFKQDYTGQSFF